MIEILKILNLIFFAVPMIYVDIREKRLPNKYMYPAMLIASGLFLIELTNLSEILPVFSITLFFTIFSFLKPKALGFGDVKGILLISLSLSKLGFSGIFLSIGISFVSASFYLILKKILQHDLGEEFAFGSFLFMPSIILLVIHSI